MKLRTAFVLFLVLALSLACAKTPTLEDYMEKGAVKVQAQELRAALPGNTMVLTSFRDVQHHFLAADGKAYVKKANSARDYGDWHVADDGTLCMRYDYMTGGSTLCLDVYRFRETYRTFFPSGTLHGRFIVEQGNPLLLDR